MNRYRSDILAITYNQADQIEDADVYITMR